MIDTKTLEITKRVEFPEGARPWMLRASPNGRVVYVQTATGANSVLDAQTLEILHTEELGEQPVTAAWSPDGRYNFVTHFADDWVAVLEPRSGRLIKRVEIGRQGANISFRPDGAYGYVAVTGEDEVAVVELDSLEVEKRLSTGGEPMGLIVI